jgi:hypothetical protein
MARQHVVILCRKCDRGNRWNAGGIVIFKSGSLCNPPNLLTLLCVTPSLFRMISSCVIATAQHIAGGAFSLLLSPNSLCHILWGEPAPWGLI